jgi:DNA helicase-4
MPEMAPLHSVVEELKSIDREIAKLNRIRHIRRILKAFVIGFFLYKDIDQRISHDEKRKVFLIKTVLSAINMTAEYHKRRLEATKASQEFLSEEQEEEWLNLIETFESDIKSLQLLNVFDSRLTSSLFDSITKSREYVIHYNENLDKIRLRQKLIELKSEIIQAENEFKLLCDRQRYFPKRDFYSWKECWKQVFIPIKEFAEKGISDIDFQNSIMQVYEVYEKGEYLIEEQNRKFVEEEILKTKLFEEIEGHSLSEEQKRAIVVDEANTLVVAGAGTGKTTTLLGKAFYIVSKGLAAPEEVLVVAFNRNVAEENRSKVNVKPGIRFAVKTYHSLGLDIISQSTGERLTVSPLWEDSQKLELKKIILEFIQKRMNEADFARLVIDYFLLYYLSYKSEFEFNSLGEYYQYLKNSEVRALKGHLVRSFEECDIANYLYVNGINYLYEEPYKFKTADSKHRQYKPDFFLPDYDIYIEHFGIDRNRRTPSWISQDKYIEEMEWKESTHKKHKTTLIKTYSFERKEGKLLGNLQSNLIEKGVVFQPLLQNQIFEKLNKMGRVNSLASLLSTFLNLYKSSGKSLVELKNEISQNDKRARMFLKIFSAILEDYEEHLRKENHIDFNDMINDATRLVEQGKYASPFKYILVDEFQDISQSRYRFLKALLRQNAAKLFCVGDDWQSIYRFTGGDISIMVDFEKNFGFSETRFIQETRRFGDKLCDFSTRFILQNPIQIKKRIVSKKKESKPAVTIIRDKTEKALKRIINEIRLTTNRNQNADSSRKRLWIINRYNTIGKPENLEELVANNPEIEIVYRTAHNSKGLETDYVALVGLRNGVYGFPCQIEDDPILNLVLAKPEHVKNAEERRLFYVAMTRAKEHVYLVVDKPYNVSSFVTEIENNEYEINAIEKVQEQINCPGCKTGTIISERERNRCSNYPYCDYKPKKCPKCGNGFIFESKLQYRCSNDKCSFEANACPRCEDGYLVLRQDKNGKPFYGCSNFSTKGCRYTEEDFHRKKHYRDYVT